MSFKYKKIICLKFYITLNRFSVQKVTFPCSLCHFYRIVINLSQMLAQTIKPYKYVGQSVLFGADISYSFIYQCQFSVIAVFTVPHTSFIGTLYTINCLSQYVAPELPCEFEFFLDLTFV